MAVKALSQSGCALSGLFNAIRFAADNGADVINMSLGFVSLLPKAHLQGFTRLFHLFAQYALVKGVSAVVVAAGYDAIDLDHDGNGFDGLCDAPGMMCVSATGPTSSGLNNLGPFIDIDAPAFYTQFGSSAIDVAAPGGNLGFDAVGNVTGFSLIYGACASTTLVFENGAFHPDFCTGRTNIALGALGTSAAAPHVAGLAALLVSQLGHGHQSQVRAAIEQSANDLGKPGHDPFYGQGRINVARAVGLL
jgi:lantibiotic leader peptide-processing serine protease